MLLHQLDADSIILVVKQDEVRSLRMILDRALNTLDPKDWPEWALLLDANLERIKETK